jgi:general secretion pathway protein C
MLALPRNLLVVAARIHARLGPHAHHAPRIAGAVLGAFVLVQAANVAQSLAALLNARATLPEVATSAPSALRSSLGLEQIAAAHLFGEASGTTTFAAPAAAPATSLDLTLTGTLLEADGTASQAIIGDGRTEQTYRAGDMLESGIARLHTVYADRVVIERDGRLESLLPRDWEPSGAPRPMLAAAAPPAADAAPLPGPVPVPVPQYAAATRAAAAAAAERLRAPGESPVAGVIRFETYNDGGVVGLRASPGRNSQTFRDLGLKAGDVITSVNGAALGSRPNGTALVQALQTSPVVNVSLVRDGIPQVVAIPAAAFGERFAQR